MIDTLEDRPTNAFFLILAQACVRRFIEAASGAKRTTLRKKSIHLKVQSQLAHTHGAIETTGHLMGAMEEKYARG